MQALGLVWDDVDPLTFQLMGCRQHLVGLAHPGRSAEEQLQLAAALPSGRGEERIGGRPLVGPALLFHALPVTGRRLSVSLSHPRPG